MGNHSHKTSDADEGTININTQELFKGAREKIGTPTFDSLLGDWTKVAKSEKNTIHFKEFKKLMQDHLTEDQLKMLFQLYDINHDNQISFQEYVCLVVLLMKASEKEKIRLLFNCFDTDKNGGLSYKEFHAAINRCTPTAKKGAKHDELIKKLWTDCDKDKDGSISPDEFINWVDKSPDAFKQVCGFFAQLVG